MWLTIDTNTYKYVAQSTDLCLHNYLQNKTFSVNISGNPPKVMSKVITLLIDPPLCFTVSVMFVLADSDEEDDDQDPLKSEISLVHEIALKRNLHVNFEVWRMQSTILSPIVNNDDSLGLLRHFFWLWAHYFEGDWPNPPILSL